MPVPNTNKYEDIAGTGVTVITTRKDDVFLISTRDVDTAKRHCWSRHENGYARAVTRLASGKMKTVYLHRLICPTTESHPHVDHANGQPNDCRRENLRCCTRSENQMNMKRRKDSGTRLKGVGIQSQTGRYRARVKVGGVYAINRTYETKEEAYAEASKVRELAHDSFCRHS